MKLSREGFVLNGWRSDLENRHELRRTSTSVREVLRKKIDCPRSFDPRPLFDNDPRRVMRTEDQGQIGSCFPAGTKVTMADGSLMAIEDVMYGHFVLTHKGRSRQVVDTMSRAYTGTLYDVFVKGWGRIKMTSDHLVRVSRNGELQWVRADCLVEGDCMVVSHGIVTDKRSIIDVSDYVDGPLTSDGDTVSVFGSPQFHSRFIPLDELTCFVLGLYVAEGSTDGFENGNRSRASFTLHQDEVEYANKISDFAKRCGANTTVYRQKKSKAMNVRITSPVLARFFEKTCGKFCNGKRVPHFIVSASEAQKTAFIHGYFCGDGCLSRYEKGRVLPDGSIISKRQIHAATASRILAQQVSTLAVSIGMKPGRSRKRRQPHQRYPSYQVYLYSRDACRFFGDDYKSLASNSRWREEARVRTCDEGQLRVVREIKTSEVASLPVYDFTVDEDHSFVAQGLVVHNCAGWGGSSSAEFVNWVDTGDMTQLSANFLYCAAQKEDGITGDNGSTINGCSQVLRKYGIPREEVWPYPSRYDNNPPEGWEHQYEAASEFKIKSHTFLENEDDVVKYLQAGLGGVQIGITWGGDVDRNGEFRWRPQGGGHSVCILGWKEINGDLYVWLLNSWGKKWGDDGWALVRVKSTLRAMIHERNSVFVGYSDMENPKPRSYKNLIEKGGTFVPGVA